MKLVTNLVLGLHRAVLAEGLTFARALGLDGRAALDLGGGVRKGVHPLPRVLTVPESGDCVARIAAFVPGDEPAFGAVRGAEEVYVAVSARHPVDAWFGGGGLGVSLDHVADDLLPVNPVIMV